MLCNHHWVNQVPWTRPPLGPNVLDAYEKAVTVLTDLELSGREITGIVVLLSNHVDGAARVAVEAVTLPASTALDDGAWWESVAPVLEKVWDPERFPTLSSPNMASAWEQTEGARDYFLAEAKASFEFGLELVLDWIERSIDRKAGR